MIEQKGHAVMDDLRLDDVIIIEDEYKWLGDRMNGVEQGG